MELCDKEIYERPLEVIKEKDGYQLYECGSYVIQYSDKHQGRFIKCLSGGKERAIRAFDKVVEDSKKGENDG